MTEQERQLREAELELEAIELELDRRAREVARNRWCPHVPTPAQAAFLALEDDEALYGGAAGGGKSDALLMAALRGADTPGYAAILFRRTYADLALPGALMDRAKDWLAGTAAHWSDKTKTWTFPSGATLTFGYLEHEDDKYRYKSAEFHFVGFDELTQFSETQYTYLLSRLRRTAGFSIKPHARAASNPGGPGHDWVHARFVDEKTASAPFVPARLADNPHIDEAEYSKQLDKLDSTTRMQLKEGRWVRDSGGLIYPYKRELVVIDALPEVSPRDGWNQVLAIDLGSSQKAPSTTFTIPTWHIHLPEVYIARSYGKAGMIPSTIAEEILELEQLFGGFERIVVDDGGLGGGYLEEFRDRYAIHAEPAEKRSKLGFRKLLRGAIERGEVKIVGPMCEMLLAEMDRLMWNDDGDDVEEGASDHQTDGLLYGWRASYAYLAVPPEKKPAPGSREALEAEIQRIEDAEDEDLRDRAQRRRGKAWWQRGRSARS